MGAMHLRRRVAAAVGLATLLPLLAGCGEDAGELEVGDVVSARDEGQFADGRASFVMLPIGRLEVSLGEPVTELGERDTRDLTPQQAPAGATFVPITWQYDAGTFGLYDEYLGDPASPVIDLVSDSASYRLPPPAEVGESSESFYVLVSGSADDAELSVDYDGVVQTLDLFTGERDEGAAAALYDLEPLGRPIRSCKEAAEFGQTQGFPDYRCKIGHSTRLPYANGEWAEPGRTWLGVSLSTAVRRFDVYGPAPGSGALYVSDSVESTFRIGDAEPVGVIPDPGASCPDTVNGGCTGSYHLVFDVPEKSRTRLLVEQTFRLVLGSQWGGVARKPKLNLDVSVEVPLR
jgi:hypothetical protein